MPAGRGGRLPELVSAHPITHRSLELFSEQAVAYPIPRSHRCRRFDGIEAGEKGVFLSRPLCQRCQRIIGQMIMSRPGDGVIRAHQWVLFHHGGEVVVGKDLDGALCGRWGRITGAEKQWQCEHQKSACGMHSVT